MSPDRSPSPHQGHLFFDIPPNFSLWRPATWRNVRLAKLLILVGGLVAVAWTVAVWYGTDWDMHRRQAEEVRHMTGVATLSALSLSENIDRRLEALRTVPEFVTHFPNQKKLLLEANRSPPGRRDFAGADDVAKRYEEFTRRNILQGLFLLTADGRCIVAATEREDARAACRHDEDILLRLPPPGDIGFGVLAGRPSLFHLEPFRIRGRTDGWVVAQLEMAAMGKNLVDIDAFVTDRNGVVLMTRNPDWWLRTLPNASVYKLTPAERLLRYGRQNFRPLPLLPLPDASGWVWGGGRNANLLVTRSYRDGLLSIHIVRQLPRVEKLRQDRIWVFAVFWLLGILVGTLVWGGFFVLDQTKRYNREIRHLNADLARQARIDELTEIANRRQFFVMLEAERRRGLRYGKPFAVLEIDFDHFKAINDRWGHAIGDKALRHVAALMQGMVRTEDVPARLGGDEFAMILPETDAAQAVQVAGRLCNMVAKTPLPLDTAEVSLSLSIGVAQWYPEAPETTPRLLSRADQALYLAKEAGRGRVQPEISPPDAHPGGRA